MANSSLEGRVAIITGAGGGLGSAMAEALIGAGASVVVVDIAADGLDRLAAWADGQAGQVVSLTTDIREPANCARIVERAVAEFGAVHALVNNAGVGLSSIRHDYYKRNLKFWDVPDDAWRTIVDTNAFASFALAKAVVPHLIEQRWGRIVNVTTSLDTMIRPGWTPYGPSKAALEACAANWAGDLEGSGVTVNVLIPGGPANTAMVPAASSPDRDAMVQPEVMKAPIRWLLSQDSDGISGRRISGVLWDTSILPAEAAENASAPIAWPGAGQQAVWPGAP